MTWRARRELVVLLPHFHINFDRQFFGARDCLLRLKVLSSFLLMLRNSDVVTVWKQIACHEYLLQSTRGDDELVTK